MATDPSQEFPVDAVTGTTTTGHVWDDIRELNTPLPRWWLWLFYATIIWSIGYWILYPAWPLLTTSTQGVLHWHSRAAVHDDLAALQTQRAGMTAKIAAAPLQEILNDPQMLTFARALAKPVFAENCAPCHGAGGAGSRGYPNLNDDKWLWGGKLDDIAQTIRHGARAGDDEGHQGNMPAFGRDGMLQRPDVLAVAAYVRSLSGLTTPEGADLARGKQVFAENCAVCHGENAQGNREVGAPNLTDNIWLYASDFDTIVDGVWNGHGGIMPSWSKRGLDETTIKALAVYVWSFGGGEK